MTGPAIVLDGRALAARIRDDLKPGIADLKTRGILLSLLIFAGEADEPGLYYARAIERAGRQIGVGVATRVLERGADDSVTRDRARDAVEKAGADPDIHGILLQRPMPEPFDARALSRIVPVAKDVDGANPYNFGLLAAGEPRFVPATAAAAIEMLRLSPHWPPARAHAIVIGRSIVVGRPLAMLLTASDATVTLCHSRTRNLAELCRSADIVFAALGRPGFVTADFIRPGATVIDIGTNLVDGKVVGDVDGQSVGQVAGALTPVPGGVGPVTTAILLRNVVDAAKKAQA